MSNPNINSITPTISLSTAQTVPLLLASIALEELALAHLVNAEAEKIQFVLGTLTPARTRFTPETVTLSNLLTLDASVRRTLRDVIKKEMLLEFKFENVLDLIAISSSVTVTLIADPTNIAIPGCPPPNSSTLNGQVLVDGSPAPINTPVFFTLSDPSLGTVTPNPAFTDASGNFTATFNASVSGGGSEVITASALGQNSNSVTINIRVCAVQPGLTITKSGPTSVGPGGNITYTINVTNTGNVPLTNLTIMDNIDISNVTLVSVSPPPAGFTVSSSANSITWTGPASFAPGSSAIFQFTVRMNPGRLNTTNRAEANSTETGQILSNAVLTVVL